MLLLGLRGGGGFLEGAERVRVGGVGAEDGVEHGEFEEAGDDGRGGGEAQVAVALTQGGHVADDEAEAHAVQAMDLGEVEDDLRGRVGAALELGFEGGGFGAESDGAVAVDRVDVVGELGGEIERHVGCGNHTSCRLLANAMAGPFDGVGGVSKQGDDYGSLILSLIGPIT